MKKINCILSSLILITALNSCIKDPVQVIDQYNGRIKIKESREINNNYYSIIEVDSIEFLLVNGAAIGRITN